MTDTCAICLEPLLVDNESQQYKIKECSHQFHTDCIIQALRFDSRCPVCRSRPETKQVHQPEFDPHQSVTSRMHLELTVPIDNYVVTSKLITKVSKLDPDIDLLRKQYKAIKLVCRRHNLKQRQLSKRLMKQKTYASYAKAKSTFCRYKSKAWNIRMDLIHLVHEYIASHEDEFPDLERVPVEDILIDLQNE
jgi:hypothetical protein